MLQLVYHCSDFLILFNKSQDFLSDGMGEVQEMQNAEEDTMIENKFIESNMNVPDEEVISITMSHHL